MNSQMYPSAIKTSHERTQEAQVHKYSESNTPRDIEIKSKILPITKLENLERERERDGEEEI